MWVGDGLALAGGSQDFSFSFEASLDFSGELAAGVALVADDLLAATQGLRQEERRSATSRSGWSAGARIEALGVPSGAQQRCRRMLQNQRECERQ